MSSTLRLRPSAATRWIACPGSAHLTSRHDLESEESRYAREGSVAHQLAADTLVDHFTGVDVHLRMGEPEERYPDVYDDDMRAHAEWYRGVCAAIVDLYNCDRVFVEMRAGVEIPLERANSADFEQVTNGGTADFTAINSLDRTLIVIDYKYGAGLPVEAIGNLQCLNYAIRMANDHAPDPERVIIIIAQPRVGAKMPAPWIIERAEFALLREQFERDIWRTVRSPDLFKIGDHCRWCPASGGHCKAQVAQISEVAAISFPDVPPDLPSLADLTPERIAFFLKHKKAVSTFFKDLTGFATKQALAGLEVPGYKLVQSLGDRTWVDVEVVKGRFKKRALSEPKVLSPAQLEKVVGKGMIDEYTFRPERGPELAPLTDKRRPYVPALKAAEAFDAADQLQQKGGRQKIKK